MDNLLNSQITIGQLKNFVLVVEEKGFHAAAKKIGRSQPAISKSIKKLETELGGELFEKGSNATLTSLGHYFFPQAKDLVTQYEKVMTDILLFSNKQAGQVTLAVLPSVAGSILPRIIKEYIELYPNIQISIQDENSETIQRRVLNGTIDFGVSQVWEAHPELEAVDLLQDPIGLVCSNRHPLAQVDEVSWEMLRGNTFISNGTVRLLHQAGIPIAGFDAQLSMPNMASLVAMLEADIGITTLPYLAFPKDSQKLTFKPIADPVVERKISLVSRRKFSGSPAVQAMKEVILKHFQMASID